MHRRLIALPALAAFVATVYLANWLVNTYGPIRVWPFHLFAPAGVYVVGLAFLLRDTVQRLAGVWLALLGVAAGTLLSVLVSPRLALASGVAFACSELAGLAIFRLAGGQIGSSGIVALAVIASSVVAAALDSYLFLRIAFGPSGLGFWDGQMVGKLTVTLLFLPLVLGARRRLPVPA